MGAGNCALAGFRWDSRQQCVCADTAHTDNTAADTAVTASAALADTAAAADTAHTDYTAADNADTTAAADTANTAHTDYTAADNADTAADTADS